MATKKKSSKPKSITKSSKKASVTTGKSVKQTAGVLKTINHMHILSLILFLGLGLASLLLMQSVTFPVSITHLTSDELLSRSSAVFSSAERNVYDIDIRWMVGGVMIISSLLPLLYLSKLKTNYQKTIQKTRVGSLRSLDLAVSSALMINVIMLLVGYNDLMTLKFTAGLVAITVGLCWLSDGQNKSAKKPVWSAFILSLLSGSLAWLAVGVSMFATVFYGSVRSPWYVYAVSMTVLLGFALLAFSQFNSIRRFRNWANYEVAERNYLLINLTTKAFFAGILVAGLMK